MKKKIIISILILFCVIIGTMCYMTTKKSINKISNDYGNIQVSIEEREYKKIGDNLYYTDELIESKGRDKEVVLDYYQIISDYIKENFDIDVYISNLNYYVDEMYFNGYQMINEIIIEDVYFTMIVQSDKVSDIYFSRYESINENIDENDLISIEKMKETASNLAKENAYLMFTNSINGEYYLEYDKTNGIYYNVNLNNGSYIKINAKTGNVIDTYFFDGVYY